MINRAHGGNIRAYEKDSSPGGKIIDFSANINPLGMSSKVRKALIKNLDALIHYPEPESRHLRKSLASFHHIGYNNLLMGNGSIELIHLIPRALKAKNVLIVTPTFSEYEFAVKSNGARPVFVKTTEREGFKLNNPKVMKFIPGVDLVFLCNPNNPTGSYLCPGEILALLELCTKHRTILVLDEAFMDFVESGDEITMVNEAAKNKFLLVLRSLTKFFALPGLRLGYLIGHRDLVGKISPFQYPWNVNSLAQIAGEEVIKDRSYIRKSKEYILRERRYLFANLKGVEGLKVYPPSSNFILCKLENGKIRKAKNLSQKLTKRGIIIRRGHNFRGLNDRFFRVAVRKRDENIKLISALKGCGDDTQ
ncbi:MAG: Threonine-phosphate decarboxylase [Syntrophomonadaceae bacterium]|nr:Threonine-phosphate decarboxylase [Bacillota bacterium]